MIPAVEASPRLYARIGGALYVLLIVLGAFAEIARDSLIVSGNARATAANLMAREALWRYALAAEFVVLVAAVALAVIYFVLLRPVSRELNLLATCLRLVAVAVQAVAVLNLATALFPLANTASLKVFSPEQLYALTGLAIRSYAYGYSLALLMFGACFLVHGYLIVKSTFLPRVLGVLIQLAGLAYMTNSLALFIAPAFQDRIFPLILLPSFVGELSLSLWLLIAGVNEQRWKAMAGPARSVIS